MMCMCVFYSGSEAVKGEEKKSAQRKRNKLTRSLELIKLYNHQGDLISLLKQIMILSIILISAVSLGTAIVNYSLLLIITLKSSYLQC